jgi:hypothetical protein
MAGLQAWPLAFLARQLPPGPLQYVPLAQSLSLLHVFEHAPAEQTKGAQACVVDVQVPPLQVPASFSVAVLWQLACEHVVPSAYFWQPPAPLHLPFVPQVVGP